MGGMLTVNKGCLETPVLPVTEKSGLVCVPWSEIQTGLPFANETPQGFFSMASVAFASRPRVAEQEQRDRLRREQRRIGD